MACTLAESLNDPLHRKLRQLCCLRCRFDCFRVERTSSRTGVAPAGVQRLSRRTITIGIVVAVGTTITDRTPQHIQELFPIAHGPSTASACCGPGGTKPTGAFSQRRHVADESVGLLVPFQAPVRSDLWKRFCAPSDTKQLLTLHD